MDVSEELKLKRFLYYASEKGCFIPGCRFSKSQYYKAGELTCVRNLINSGNHDVIFDAIKKVDGNKLPFHPDPCLFVLASCIKLDLSSKDVITEAYRLAEGFIITAENLFIFVKFLKDLSGKKGFTGRGIKRVIRNFYLKKPTLQLAEAVVTVPRFHKWSHGDLLKLAHVKSTDPAKQAVITYAIRGIKKTEWIFKDNDSRSVHDVLGYLKTVCVFKKLNDPVEAFRMINSHMLSYRLVPSPLYQKHEVWMALIHLLALDDLILKHIHFISKMRKKFPRSVFKRITEEIDCHVYNGSKLLSPGECSKVYPSDIKFELLKYKLIPKWIKSKQGTLLKTAGLCQPKYMPKFEVLENCILKNVRMKNKKILVVMHQLAKDRSCFHQRYLPTPTAVSLFQDCLTEAGNEVTSENVKPLCNTYCHFLDLECIIPHILKKQYDCVVAVGNHLKIPKAEQFHEMLEKCKESNGGPLKIATFSLVTKPKWIEETDHPGLLNFVGYHSSSYKIFEAFVMGDL